MKDNDRFCEHVLSVTLNIDSKTVANTRILRSAGGGVIVTRIVLRSLGTQTATVAPTIGFGTASGTNDIIAAALSGMVGPSSIKQYFPSVIPTAGQDVWLNLTVAASAPSFYNIACDVHGYFAQT